MPKVIEFNSLLIIYAHYDNEHKTWFIISFIMIMSIKLAAIYYV